MQNMVENQEKEVRFHRFYLVPKRPILALKGTTYLEQNLHITTMTTNLMTPLKLFKAWFL